MNKYPDCYRHINFRYFPQLYRIGKGEQGVLIAEPYKSEILPFWRFKTPEIAKQSAKKIYELFLVYKEKKEFVGMDMARKFLQMGFTRARRYANHKDGKKYTPNRKVKAQEKDWNESAKAQSAAIFYRYYLKAKEDLDYLEMKKKHQIVFESNS